MSKFLSVLATGLIAASLTTGAFATESAKPQQSAAAAAASKPSLAAKPATSKVAMKKDTSIKASVKKLVAPNDKKHTS